MLYTMQRLNLIYTSYTHIYTCVTRVNTRNLHTRVKLVNLAFDDPRKSAPTVKSRAVYGLTQRS